MTWALGRSKCVGKLRFACYLSFLLFCVSVHQYIYSGVSPTVAHRSAYSAVLLLHGSVVRPCETAVVSAQVLCTPYNYAPVYSVSLFREATYAGCTCVLPVICHLHFWQNDRDLSRATAVARGSTEHGYRNKSQNRKLTREKK